METFPSIGDWIADGSTKDSRQGNPTSRSAFYSGYTQTMNRFTWVPKVFQRKLVNLSLANRATIDEFQVTVGYGMDIFNWSDPVTETVFQVRFDTSSIPLSYSHFGGDPDRLQIPMNFLQATPDELTYTTEKEGVMKYQVENLAAGSDIVDRPIFTRGYAYSFTKATLLTQGTPAGITDANTAGLTLKNGAGSTIVAKTFNTATQPPTNDSVDLGTLSITSIVAGDIITYSLGQGAAANMPLHSIILE